MVDTTDRPDDEPPAQDDEREGEKKGKGRIGASGFLA